MREKRIWLAVTTRDKAQEVGGLLDRAVAAGVIRSDISPEDLLRALVGMCYLHDQPGWQNSVLRLVDVFVDGLRVPANVDGRTLPDRGARTVSAKRPSRLRLRKTPRHGRRA